MWVNKIVGMLPNHDLDTSVSAIFKDITLADPTFHKHGLIDILLGVDLALHLLKRVNTIFRKKKKKAICYSLRSRLSNW